MPKVSVIIPTYNRAEFLRSAVASVLNQTFQDFEILVVDNGSNDYTPHVVTGFNDTRLRYLRIDLNNGVSPARNLGITHSKARFVAFLDDDDEWLPRKLERQVSILENSPSIIGAVYTGYVVIDRTTGLTIGQVIPKKQGDLFTELCIRNCIGTSTVLVKAECFERAGLFDEGIAYAEEYDLWLRIAREFHFECIEEPLVHYSYHLNNASSNWEHVIKGLEAVEKKHGQVFARHSKGYSYFNLALGALYCYAGDGRRGRQAFLKAIRLYPSEIRNYFYLGLSLLGTVSFRKLTDAILKTSLKRRERYYLPSRREKISNEIQ